MRKILIIFSFCFGLLIGCKKDPVTISNPGYAIGIVLYYLIDNGRTSSQIEYNYYVNNKLYDNGYVDSHNGWSVPNHASYQKGDQFMVQYDQNNIGFSRMLFSYPVKDSADYIKYVNQFKTNPPGN